MTQVPCYLFCSVRRCTIRSISFTFPKNVVECPQNFLIFHNPLDVCQLNLGIDKHFLFLHVINKFLLFDVLKPFLTRKYAV